MMKLPITLLLALILSYCLSACSVAVVGGIAAGSAVIMDKRSASALLEDQNIKLKFSSLFEKDKDLSQQTHVNVTSYNQRMLITGEAPEARLKQQLTELANQIDNVRAVFNEVEIAPLTSMSSRTNDSFLTSKIKTSLLTSDQLSGAQIKLVTENGSVFLMGLVTRQQADIIVDITRTTVGVKRVIKLFEYINPDKKRT